MLLKQKIKKTSSNLAFYLAPAARRLCRQCFAPSKKPCPIIDSTLNKNREKNQWKNM